MKYEWRKAEKEIYLPKQKPVQVEVPKYKYYTITGKGNPNEEAFSERVGALYAASYGIKMMPKKGTTPEGYFPYTVFPLEGIWSLEEAPINQIINKDDLVYKIMIRQPDFITEELAIQNLESIKISKPNPYLNDVVFEELTDGLCVQMLHVGPYDNEPETFSIMNAFMENQELERRTYAHKEVYLSDPRRSNPETMKTALRYFVKPKVSTEK